MSYITNSFDERVVKILQDGGVGFMPSGTIYGLSCRALDESAVNKVYNLKDRNPGKAFIVLISDIKMLDLLSISRSEIKLAQKYWPGQLTIECLATNSPQWLPKINNHFGVRMPKNISVLGLIKNVGPIISTSANKEGQKPASTMAEAQKYFGQKLDFYVNKGRLSGQPSTIAKASFGQLEVIRQGAVKL